MTEPTAASERLASAGPTRPSRRKAKPGASGAGSAKESRAEEILHELFRTQGMDLRESPRTVGLVRDFVKSLGKEAK